jgi:hypothetical protein
LTDLSGRYHPSAPGLEFGDEITLDNTTTDRTLSRFQFSYNFSGASVVNQTWTLRLYANDGAAGAPGSLLYDGPQRPVALGDNSPDIDFSLFTPALILPETFTWTIQFSGLSGTETGDLFLYGPPNKGSSLIDFWERDSPGGPWSTHLIQGGAVRGDFTARISAVPEPGVLVLGGLGALLLAGLGRLRKAPR